MGRQAIKMMDPDLQELAVTGSREKFTQADHELRIFFMDRHVTQAKLAKVCGVVGPWISEGMRGIRNLSDSVEEKLFELRDKILAWEQREGRRFNSPAPKV